MLITAPGVVCKSVMAQRIDLLLPPGSEAVVFDGFAGGRYRSPSEVRHRHDVGLVHIVNTLAGRGLCDILVPTMAPRHEYLRAFRQRLEQAAAIVRDRTSTTSELQSLMRTSYAVFCLKKKKAKKSIRHLNRNMRHQ